MSKKRRETPEWNIFDRLDELENITLDLMDKTVATEPTLRNTTNVATEALSLATVALVIAFTSASVSNPPITRRLRGICVRLLERQSVSKKTVENLASRMATISEIMDRRAGGDIDF
jgi:hypothetical protein